VADWLLQAALRTIIARASTAPQLPTPALTKQY